MIIPGCSLSPRVRVSKRGRGGESAHVITEYPPARLALA
jgi:hypothetical protein